MQNCLGFFIYNFYAALSLSLWECKTDLGWIWIISVYFYQHWSLVWSIPSLQKLKPRIELNLDQKFKNTHRIKNISSQIEK